MKGWCCKFYVMLSDIKKFKKCMDIHIQPRLGLRLRNPSANVRPAPYLTRPLMLETECIYYGLIFMFDVGLGEIDRVDFSLALQTHIVIHKGS